MDCTGCGHDSRAGAKFCAECGSPLKRICSSCGNELRPAARFCDECGAPTDGPLDDPRALPSRSFFDDAVRKTVTVLFCDVVGSTAFAERVDAEAAREAMGQYHSMARDVIAAKGGVVAKFIGDGVMALWGVPEVAEEDAKMAVAGGLALQRGFESIAGHIADRFGVEVSLRVGINTGEVVIADRDADLVGDVLNTAARLEAACLPGQVLVGEGTWRLTRSSVSYGVRREVTVKGKAEAVATFQVLEQSIEGDEAASPFVGRSREVAVIRHAFEAAVDRQTAKLVTVIGPPGVGKTRLAAEVMAGLETATRLEVRCERSSDSAFEPIRDLLLRLVRMEPESGSGELVASLEDLFGLEVRDRDRLVELLGSLVGASSPRSTEETLFAIRRTLEVLGSQRPVVMVVDDIQWAEPLLLDLLEHLAEWVSGGAVLIVGLARPEIRSLRASLAEPGRRVATVVSLEGLDADATEELAAQLLGVAVLPRGLVARLPESTEGNPLFVRELVRMLADDGVIVRSGDTYELTIDADAVEVPPSIQSLLAARVERLPHDERRILELASVVGAEFPLGALVAVASGFSTAEVGEILERLRRKELIDPAGIYWGDEPVLRFHHLLIRDAAYRRVLKGTRADLHLAIGRWIEQTAASLIGDHEVTIAQHYEQVHQYRSELGALDDETWTLGRRAARMLHVAAERALESDDVAVAGSLAGRALACLDDGDRIRPTILLLACEALASSDIPAARSAVSELRAVADDARLAAWATCFESQLTVMTDPLGLLDAAAACVTAALTLVDLGDVAGVAKAHQVRAGALARLGRVGDCEAELDLALTAARAADNRRRVTAVLGAAPQAALWGPSPVPQAGGRCLDVIRLLRLADGSPVVEATSVRCHAVLEALRGRFDTAREMLESSRRTAEEFGLRMGLMETELYAGIVELLAEEPAAAETHLRVAHAGLDRLGIGSDAGQAAAYLARALLLQDDLDAAEQFATEADEHAGLNLQTTIAAKSVRAEVLTARNRHDEAVALAQQAAAIAEGTDILVDHAIAVEALARVLRAAGRQNEATTAERQAARLWKAKGAAVDEGRLIPTSESARGLTGSDQTAASAQGNKEPKGVGDERAAQAARSAQGQRFLGLGESGTFDLDRYVAMLAPDLVRDDRRSASGTSMGAGGRADFVAGLDAMRAIGGNFAELTPLAAAGDRLLLVEGLADYGDGNHTSFIVLLRWNAHDLIDLITVFGEDDRRSAEIEMVRLASLDTTMEPPQSPAESVPDSRQPRSNRVVEVVRRLLAAPPPVDLDALLGGLATGFVRDDRRSGVSFPIADRATYVESVRPFFASGGTIDVLEVSAVRGERLAMTRSRMNFGDGNVRPFLSVIGANSQEELDRIIVFDPDDGRRAMLELDELYREELAEAIPRNDAWRSYESGVKALASGDFETMEGTLSPRFHRVDRRIGFSLPAADRQNYMEAMRTLVDVGGSGVFASWHPVGTRGDHLMLAQTSLVRAGGQVTDHFVVVRTEERGLADLMVVFDADDRAGAVNELDRLDVGRRDEGARPNRASIAWDRFAQAVVESRYADAWLLLAPEMVRDDKRTSFSMPTANRDQYVASIELLADGGIDLSRKLIATRGEGLALFELAMLRPNGDSTNVLHINAVDDAGRITRALVLDPVDLDAAMLELDRLHAERRGSRASAVVGVAEVSNRCSEIWVSHIGAAVNANDWQTAGDLFSDAFRFEVHRRTVSGVGGGKAEFRAHAGSWLDVGTTTESTPIAVRGNHLALLETRARGSEGFVRTYGVAEVNDSGVASYLGVWDEDDLQLAQDELNRRWLTTVDDPVQAAAELAIEFANAVVHADLEWLDVHIAQGFESNDHRPAGLGDRDRATFMAMVGQRPTTVGDGVMIISEFLRCDPEWVIASVDGRTRPPSGGGYVSEKVTAACRLDGQRLLRSDIYPLERPDLALVAAEEALDNR